MSVNLSLQKDRFSKKKEIDKDKLNNKSKKEKIRALDK
jgi:hypothetical protein